MNITTACSSVGKYGPLAKKISPDRIKTYVDWFYNVHLRAHFELEENHIFPILGHDHQLMPEELDWDSPTPTQPDSEGNYPVPIPGKTNVL